MAESHRRLWPQLAELIVVSNFLELSQGQGGVNLRQERHYAAKFLASYFAADSVLLAFDAKQSIKANSSD